MIQNNLKVIGEKMNKRIYDYLEIRDLKDMLNKTGKLYADRPAYKIKVEEGKYQTYTHKEIRDMINDLGTALINLGLKGKRIAVIGENRYEWEIAYLSIVCGTGIVVPLDKSLPANELELLIERSDVEAIFYTKKYSDIIQNIKFSEKNKLKHLISMDNDENCEGIYSQKELIREGKKLIEEGNNEFLNAKINPKEMEIMLFTSGTTSKSKVVALSHENICTNLMDIGSVLDVTQDDVFLSILPIHHVFECTVGFLFSLYKGAETVFCDGLRHIVENLNEYHVTVMACVPGIYERIFMMIRKKLEKQGKLEEILENEEKYKNSSMQKKKEVFKEIHDMLGGKIKLLISGAAALDKTIEEKYRLLGLNLVQGYGLTETSPVVAVGTNKNYKLGSIGKTVPSVEAKLVDVNDDGIGELVVRGSSVMLGYYENEKVNKKSLQDGWFYTGDLAKIDEEGYIFICGRKKSVIVLKNGKNIFPEEMENLVNKIEGIKESFIFGKIQSNDENNIKINVKIVFDRDVIKDVYKVEKDEDIYKVLSKKIKEVNQTMPSYKAIRGMILTEEPLIKTTTNKIKRQENLDAIRKLKD
jgi:long-chain acyl-CoA synthetase